MSSSSSTCIFDGKCAVCEDGNLTLKFDDGYILKTHSQRICEASPVLKTAIENCANKGEIPLVQSSRPAWIEILREIYTDTQSTIHKNVFDDEVDILENMAREAQKYDIGSVLQKLDMEISRRIFRLQFGGTYTTTANSFVKIAARYDLKVSKELCSEYIIKSLACTNYRYTEDDKYSVKENELAKMAPPLDHLISSGDHQWNSRFLCEILRRVWNMNIKCFDT